MRSDVTGPSSGISTAFADCRAEEARVDLTVPELALRAVDVVDVRVERDDARPGMFAIWLVEVAVVVSSSGVLFGEC